MEFEMYGSEDHLYEAVELAKSDNIDEDNSDTGLHPGS
jgi:hypothetical protein